MGWITSATMHWKTVRLCSCSSVYGPFGIRVFFGCWSQAVTQEGALCPTRGRQAQGREESPQSVLWVFLCWA